MDSSPPIAGGDDYVENRIFDEIAVGDSASVTHEVTRQDIELFALVSGDVNPAHVDPVYAEASRFHRVIAHGMIGAGLISSVLGTRLPGPGTIYLAQDLSFRRAVAIGDVVTARVTVTERNPAKGDLTLACVCVNQDGEQVITGVARVRAPTERVRRLRVELPDLRLARHERHRALLARARGAAALPTAVVFPCDDASLQAAIEAGETDLIEPVLVGPAAKIAAVATRGGFKIAHLRIVDSPTDEAASIEAVRLAERGEVAMLMKGALHTDTLLHAVLQSGLRTPRRLSHVYVFDVPAFPRPLLLTDAAVNIAPDLDAKRDIVQNAIDFAHALGIATPRVAVLAAVETVSARMPSTLDAAALCKMADRGQITGGLVDGPLAFDNAVSLTAAADKGIVSEVAGRADVLVAPDLEAANMLAKQLTFLAGADAAGVVLGARVPIVLTSRADAMRTRLGSCAAAILCARSSGPRAETVS